MMLYFVWNKSNYNLTRNIIIFFIFFIQLMVKLNKHLNKPFSIWFHTLNIYFQNYVY